MNVSVHDMLSALVESKKSTLDNNNKGPHASMAPAVTISFSPAMTSVVTPTIMPGVTPSIVSGLPALPMPTMYPFLMPMSALCAKMRSKSA